MADTTHIEWTDATWNPITGCSIVDAGCTNCYAMQLAGTRLRGHTSRAGLTRVSGGRPKWTGEVRFNEQWLDQPLRWTRPRMIFVCAHGDLFHEAVPDEWIDRVFAVMALAPQHTFQVLTKRPERARAWMSICRDSKVEHLRAAVPSPSNLYKMSKDHAHAVIGGNEQHRRLYDARPFVWPLPNVWLGTSVSDQASADLRIPQLLATPAAVRFLSAEPLLGPVDLTSIERRGGSGLMRPLDGRFRTIDWVIVGGESGPGARPMHPDWARSLRDQCVAAGVPFFFKQWGEWAAPEDHETNSPEWMRIGHGRDPQRAWVFRDGLNMGKIGKRAAGRLLDGRTWDQMPGVL